MALTVARHLLRTLLSTCLFLLLLLSPATSLQCFTCTQLGKNVCSSPFSRRCTNMMDACMSSVLDTNLFGAQRNIPQKGCRSSRLHHTANYSFHSAFEKYLHLDVQICQMNLCNAAPLQVPPRALNGLRCPGCFTQDTHVCDPVQTVNCANEEKKCIDFVGIISQPFLGDLRLAFQGCATADFCDFARKRQPNSLFTAMAVRMSCVDAQYPVQY
ncbi:hypothetical protein lerEdw1_009791 [Lerista edwardsae]|nr:hypothetical protein lerEdw1_009791 [Lerista edwardsae]